MIVTIEEPSLSFDLHYSNPSSKRILFSGKFGSGKTFFLKEYFKKKVDTVNTFWLSPVKYSVGQNEDIFEFIKFDLALKLISMPEFAPSVKVKFGEDQYFYQFLSNQPLLAIDTLAILIEAIAKEQSDNSIETKGLALLAGAKEIAKKLMNSYDKYNIFKKNIDDASKTHSDIFKKYLTDISLTKGSIFEHDLITQTIRSALDICKIQSNKKNILIIDDFDRLDPEHVFRILNILSAHNDTFDEDNKFGFDKIIIVCDYNNIEAIYKHKYGNEINFLGYISKFFSTEVFHFNNKLAIQQFCRNGLSDIVKNKNAQDVLGLLLSYFVESNILTMREIVKISIPISVEPKIYGPFRIWENIPKEYSGYEPRYVNNNRIVFNDTENFFISSEDYPFIQAIRVMCMIFGDFNSLKERIGQITNKKDSQYEIMYVPQIIKSMMTLLHHARHHLDIGRLLFSYKGDGYGHFVMISQPNATMFGLELEIATGWNREQPYTGQVSYYKNVNENIGKYDYLRNENIHSGNYKTLLEDLLLILDFLDWSGTLNHMGITKSGALD